MIGGLPITWSACEMPLVRLDNLTDVALQDNLTVIEPYPLVTDLQEDPGACETHTKVLPVRRSSRTRSKHFA